MFLFYPSYVSLWRSWIKWGSLPSMPKVKRENSRTYEGDMKKQNKLFQLFSHANSLCIHFLWTVDSIVWEDNFKVFCLLSLQGKEKHMRFNLFSTMLRCAFSSWGSLCFALWKCLTWKSKVTIFHVMKWVISLKRESYFISLFLIWHGILAHF